MIYAYNKFWYVAQSLSASQNTSRLASEASSKVCLSDIELQAGFYKLSEFAPEHSLAFTAVSGGLFPRVVTGEQRVGRRGKKSAYLVLLAKHAQSANSLSFLGRFLENFFPSILELETFKNRKWSKGKESIASFRLRKRFSVSFPEAEFFATDEVLDSHRGVFLPMTLSFRFNKKLTHPQLENFSRMLRLPISFYRWWPFPAPDDPEV